MPTDYRTELSNIRTFPALIRYLRDEMGWPIESDDFEELTFEYSAEELGIDSKNAAKIEEIKRLRPLSANQPWGIFFVKFEPKRLPVVALRRMLSQVVLKKRASANKSDRAAWAAEDLLFVSNYGEGEERRITFAHFSQNEAKGDMPILKVLGWDNLDTPLHLDDVADQLTRKLSWPINDQDADSWRTRWSSAFVLRHREVITTSKELSIRLAELARAIRNRIKSVLAIESKNGKLTKLMKAFQEALIHDLDIDGFADMYAQTIAYGLLSARITDPHQKTADDFASHLRTNPFLRELMQTFLKVSGRRGKVGGTSIDFDELGVSEVVELLDDANVEAVVRDFGDKNPQEDPVIHFYELFLKEYDAKKRMQRGVFYTPRPVVSYIVRSVDELLRTEFGLEDGLADTASWDEMLKRHKDLKIPTGVQPDQAFVQILDPACGTGTFLVEVIDVIYRTMKKKWENEAGGSLLAGVLARWNEYVPKHLLPRLHGYELLMAPYAIAHLKIGLKLYETGYRFGSDERARVYLTNALEPAKDFGGTFDFAIPALAHEAHAVSAVKEKQRFTIVIGNPPYSNFGMMNKIPFILNLLEDYKRDLDEKKLNLDDDFIKFIRLSEFFAENMPFAVFGMITNNTFLDGPTRRVMREHLLKTYNSLTVIDLHGNSIEREVCVDGSLDENVFDIQQGVAISLFVKIPTNIEFDLGNLSLYDLQGTRQWKYHWLTENKYSTTLTSSVKVIPPMFIFRVGDIKTNEEYRNFVSISSIFELSGSGVKTDRDPLCFDIDRVQLIRRMKKAFDGDWRQDFVSDYNITDSSSYALTSRLKSMSFDKSAITPCLYRLFDERWLYYRLGFTSRPAWDVMQHMLKPNIGLVVKRQARDGDYNWFFVAKGLMVDGLFSIDNKGREQLFPLYKYSGSLLREMIPNISKSFMIKLVSILGSRTDDVQRQEISPESVLRFSYSIFHSLTYRQRYAFQLPTDYPRIPLPSDSNLYTQMSALGGELIELHLMESPKLNNFITSYRGPQNPEVIRIGWSNNTVWLDAPATKKGQHTPPGSIGFRGVPEAVWNFHIGGYQVCQKWLKDRKGRTLSDDDIIHYQKIVVAISETIRIMKEIDEVIEKHGGWPGAFKTS